VHRLLTFQDFCTRSTLRTLRYGLAVAEMAVSELPSNPLAVWTVKGNSKEVPEREREGERERESESQRGRERARERERELYWKFFM
jgi:hypothetical protein